MMRTRRTSHRAAGATEALAAAVLFGCAAHAPRPSVTPPRPPPPPAAAAPAPVAEDPLAKPPPAGALPEPEFPASRHFVLDNGTALQVITRKDFPLVEVRLLVFSGVASDGERPGLGALTGELLKAGGAGPSSALGLGERADALGGRLDVTTRRDSTSLSIGVTSVDFERALDLVADVGLRPRFSPLEFEKLRQREIQRVKSEETGDADWAASMVLYRQLYALPQGEHPYSHYDATPADFERISLADCHAWYARHFTPHNALLVVAGDVDPDAVKLAAERAFAAWKGAAPAPLDFPNPAPSLEPTVWLVDRPHTAQSDIYVATLGPERSSSVWPAFAASNQILGGGLASRLFLDVREKRSLAYHTGSTAEEPAHGPVPLVLSAGTQTSKTSTTVEALLENLRRMGETPPAPWEVAMAVRSLSDEMLFRTERLGALADLAAELAVLHLPDDYFDGLRRDLEKLTPADVFTVARRYFDVEHPVIVVAGDAAEIAEPLRRFGNVEIVNPERDFSTVRELPRLASEAPSE
ncbi:MAG TPA: pitrilysin family protein [Polyangiaceae bacterium]|nr:pitrilysin family protein [Polyangiaceae bacterium]